MCVFEKYIYNILALEMASPGNQHCANCVGTLSFPNDFYASAIPTMRRDRRRHDVFGLSVRPGVRK